jgi:hypothetical protein
MTHTITELDRLIADLERVRSSALHGEKIDAPLERWSREARSCFRDYVMEIAEEAGCFLEAASLLTGTNS